VPGLTLASVVTSNAERVAAVRSAYPGASVLASADELFAAADSHELVVVAAPNRAHAALGLRAMEAGLHVVIDKPLAATLAEAQQLADAAAERGVVASVFHNRRWDGDFLTLRRLLSEGALGEPLRLESRFERWRPEVDVGKWREGGGPEDAGGVLFDLGPHLIDQAVALEHESGARTHLWGSMLAAQQGPRLRALGTESAYVKWGLDVQEAALRAGAKPSDPDFGVEPPAAWGLLGTDEDARPVETERGRYVEYYERMEEAIRARAGAADAAESGEPAPEAPVPLTAGIEVLRVIEAARDSAANRSIIRL
jgi:predicted dehydrogenase